jgi:hypothetical protein
MLRRALALLLPLLLAMSAGASPPAASERPATPAANTPPSLFAVGGPDLVAALGPLRPKVGSWAEYLVRARGGEEVRVRLSVVPPALDGGRAWLEVTALGAQDLPFAARLLLHRSGGIERAIVYALGQAPIEIPVSELQPDPAKPRRGRAVRASPVGSAEVTVPAGTFHAEELRITSGGDTTRVWRAARVPLWGLVRAEGPRQTVELTGMGETGARSVFPADQGKGSESAK